MTERIICPQCRASYDAFAKFCTRCGADMNAGRATAPFTAIPKPKARTAPEAATAEDPLIGRLVDTRYRVIARIGQGGMGVVYKVQHESMGKFAAMKVLHRELVGDKDVSRRFRREAQAVSRLTHPNTVQVFDFGTADGATYLVMEWVRGEDLGAILRRDGPIPFTRAAPLFVQICGALAEAHDLGIVHRDLKPENIIVARHKDGHDWAKVLDFGLAKLSEREEAAEVTGRGEIIGTPYYMSPEQIRGEELDHRSDIYSLGAVMYKVLTGDPPFQANSPVGVLTKHLTEDLVPPSVRRPDLKIDDRVEEVVLRALHKRREARFQSVDELQAHVERVLAVVRDEPTTRPIHKRADSTGPTPTPKRLERRAGTGSDGSSTAEPKLGREDIDAWERAVRRGKRFRLATAFVLIAGAGVAGVVLLRGQDETPRAAEVEPNDDRTTATLIAAGTPVRGKIGQRSAPDKGDRDVYRVRVGAKPSAKVRLAVKLRGIPNGDLAVSVVDASGRAMAVGDAAGVGEAELIPNLGVQDDVVYIEVRESPLASSPVPVENLTDTYELHVTASAPAADEELEPNELDSDANPLALVNDRAAVRGTLGKLADVDAFRFDGADGRYDLEVTGPTGVGVRLRVGEGEPVVGRKTRAALKQGTIVRVERVNEAARVAGKRPTAAAVAEPYGLLVRPAK